MISLSNKIQRSRYTCTFTFIFVADTQTLICNSSEHIHGLCADTTTMTCTLFSCAVFTLVIFLFCLTDFKISTFAMIQTIPDE